jgi:hypothetical protein
MLNRFSRASGSSSQRNSLFGDVTEEELPDKLCVLVEARYHEKCKTDEWSGAFTKGKEYVFAAAADGTAEAPHVGIVATKVILSRRASRPRIRQRSPPGRKSSKSFGKPPLVEPAPDAVAEAAAEAAP